MTLLQRHRQFAAPRNADQNRAACGLRSAKRVHVLGHIVEETAKTGRIAATFLILSGAAPFEEGNAEAGLREDTTRMVVPAGMTLNAVQTYQLGERLSL